jgi:UDP-N-acetyl-D-mannosaminuronic acid dehydrogenase
MNILLEKISQKNAHISIIGLGQVGLPTALTFSNSGFSVIGVDINEKIVNTLNSKKPSFSEFGLEELLVRCIENKLFSASTNFIDSVSKSDIVIVCVATPITDDVKPNLQYLESVCHSLSKLNLENKLIIIESSIPPGTFNQLILPIINNTNTKNFWTSFVPERLSPGSGLSEIRSTSRLIGTMDEESKILTQNLYDTITTGKILTTSVQVAEISKLVENTFRDVNIALANEVSKICEIYGIDMQELLRVCNSHPRVNLLNPGPGVGGPCLPKDPYLLLNPHGQKPIISELISNSRAINDSMPKHVANMVLTLLNKQNKLPTESSALILGVAYKNNVSDSRFSPAEPLIKELQENGLTVFVTDPYSNERFGAKNTDSIWDVLDTVNVIIVITDHDDFKNISLSKIKEQMKNPPIIIDTRRIFDKNKCESLGIEYLSLGYKKSSNGDLN